jgi:hypothetical protein
LTDEIIVKDVTEQNVEALCWVCISPHVRDDPDWLRGLTDKQKWAREILARWGSFAKVWHISMGVQWA